MEQSKWELKSHSYQIGDTGDYDGWHELTNGTISLGTKEDDDETIEVLQALASHLNAWDIELFDHTADDLSIDNHLLKDENARLQQEVEHLQRWKEEATLLLSPIFEYAEKHPDMKIGGSMTEFVLNRCKEYDKLKANYDHQVGINLGVHKEWIDLKKENAALQAKAEKMEAMLRDVRKNARLSIRLETEIDDCLPYNSNTNQNENNGTNP